MPNTKKKINPKAREIQERYNKSDSKREFNIFNGQKQRVRERKLKL